MTAVRMIELDPEKQSFQLHGVRADGSAAFRKQASRGRVLAELSSHSRCVVVMEACASAQDRGREFSALGDEVRLVPPAYVKPFVKRQKSDAADAGAICEAASRPTMRFVAVKSAEQQAHGADGVGGDDEEGVRPRSGGRSPDEAAKAGMASEARASRRNG